MIQGSGFGVEVLGPRVWGSFLGGQGSGFRVSGLGFGVWGSGIRADGWLGVQGLGFRGFQGLGFRILDSGIWVKISGFGIQGLALQSFEFGVLELRVRCL